MRQTSLITRVSTLLPFLPSILAQFDPNYTPGHGGIIHLFEWHWDSIAAECEEILAPAKVGGVQISPPSENRIWSLWEDSTADRPWWERYQPISYKLETRSGTRADLIDMVERCNAVGVRIYADAVINHMCGEDATIGTGTGGSAYDTEAEMFPAVPFGPSDFNDYRCDSTTGLISNYGDPLEVRNCRLVGLMDLDQSNPETASKIVAYMNDLIDIGVAGFRVDAMKHMWPLEIESLLADLNDLPSAVFGENKRAWIGSEVIDQGGEPVKANEYYGLGTVTEFNYCFGVGNLIGALSELVNLDKDGVNWGFIPSEYSFVFLNNHDNQRGHGAGGSVVDFQRPYELKIGTAFMLAHPYGSVKRVMSSYYFTDSDEGPPDFQPSPSTACAPAGSTEGWVCEHRWPTILGMFEFNGGMDPTHDRFNWWDNWGNQVAWSRGETATDSTGFFAMNGDKLTRMGGNFTTGMPAGVYKDLISGSEVNVSPEGDIRFCLEADEDENIMAIYSGSWLRDFEGMDEIDATCDTSGMEENACIDCSCPSRQRNDCGNAFTTSTDCVALGCLWCPLDESSRGAWCFVPGDEYVPPTGGPPGPSPTEIPIEPGSCEVENKFECGYSGEQQSECEEASCCWLVNDEHEPFCFYSAGDPRRPDQTTCAVRNKRDCGFMGEAKSHCEAEGCCWEESSIAGDPWCFYPE